jgi:hypothetical protein
MLSFGCRHRRISKPFAAARSQSSSSSEWESLETPSGGSHYVVCLECGKKFGYDWSQMKMIR